MTRASAPMMMDPSRLRNPNPQDLAGLGALGIGDQPGKDPYWLTFDFSTTIANTGGTQTVTANVDAAGDFIVNRMLGVFWIVSASSSSVARTPLPFDSINENSSNELPTMSQVRLLISSRSWQWMNNPVAANLILSDARHPTWFNVNPLLRARDVISMTAYNDGAMDIRGQVIFQGYRQNA